MWRRTIWATLVLICCSLGSARAASYGSLRRSIALDQARLAALARTRQPRARLLTQVEQRLLAHIDRLFAGWMSTRWGLGAPQTEQPGRGKINCGTFVGRILEHAGFNLPVRKLQRQPSSLIIRSLVPRRAIKRLGRRPMSRFLDAVNRMGPGLFLIGLDYHVGFLRQDARGLRFIHASYYKGRVVDEPAHKAVDIVWSRARVVGKLLAPPLLRKWLVNRRIAVIGDW